MQLMSDKFQCTKMLVTLSMLPLKLILVNIILDKNVKNMSLGGGAEDTQPVNILGTQKSTNQNSQNNT